MLGLTNGMVQQVRFLMNTLVRIVIYDDDETMAHRVLTLAFDEIKRLEAMMSRFIGTSDISLINCNAEQPDAIRVSAEVIDVLDEAIRIARLSNGAFDPTITPLINLWVSASKAGHLPDETQIKAALSLVDYRLIEIDRARQTVRLLRKGMALDLGGVAKGYAIDRAVNILKSCGVKNALVNMGGNIFVLGGQYSVDIQDPLDDKRIMGSITLKDDAISTSGSYERFFEVNGKRFSHIINPRTGRPVANNILSASVISRSAVLGDALSTAIFVMGLSDGMKLVESLEDTAAIIVYQDEDNLSEVQLACSESLKDKVSFNN